jgi:DNA-binding winged helix-turn-helix (wHTH) protein
MAVRLGDFTLDESTRRLLRADGEVHLSPKAFDLLNVLVVNRSRAMAKSDLHAQLWPDTFVLESNLAGLVAEIRRALGDAADRPRFIRTVPRFGYWFVGPVSQVEQVDRGPDPAADPDIRYWLVWEARQIALGAGDNVVGRAPDATIWIDALGVSRRHARIRIAEATAILEDLGSKNGTFVGGQRVTTPRLLADGDQIRLGSIVMTFRIPPPAGSTQSTGF